ncbi:hypothetical protein ACFL5V_10985 [Fibrobacterota bacterium]
MYLRLGWVVVFPGHDPKLVSSAVLVLIAVISDQALGQDNVLPFKRLWTFQTERGGAIFALLFTAGIVEALILTANLNTIAPLLTMFFLITYTMVNMVVAIEQGIGIFTFRPTFKIPLFVPVIGALQISLKLPASPKSWKLNGSAGLEKDAGNCQNSEDLLHIYQRFWY